MKHQTEKKSKSKSKWENEQKAIKVGAVKHSQTIQRLANGAKGKMKKKKLYRNTVSRRREKKVKEEKEQQTRQAIVNCLPRTFPAVRAQLQARVQGGGKMSERVSSRSPSISREDS